jgi:nucleoside-diphosphate-sugar epimerase
LYGASKAAAEGYIAAYASADLVSATVFRFVSVLGPRYSHGHVIDFVRQLLSTPDHLTILGDGRQRKSYLHVHDCAAAIVACLGRTPQFEVFNLGVDDYCTVTESAGWICERMGVTPGCTSSAATAAGSATIRSSTLTRGACVLDGSPDTRSYVERTVGAPGRAVAPRSGGSHRTAEAAPR